MSVYTRITTYLRFVGVNTARHASKRCICVSICILYTYRYIHICLNTCAYQRTWGLLEYTQQGTRARYTHVYEHTYIESMYTYTYICLYTYMYVCIHLYDPSPENHHTSKALEQDIHMYIHIYMGWLRLVGSIKLQVSFAREPYKRDDVLQKRPII